MNKQLHLKSHTSITQQCIYMHEFQNLHDFYQNRQFYDEYMNMYYRSIISELTLLSFLEPKPINPDGLYKI